MTSYVAGLRQRTVARLARLAAFRHVFNSRQPMLRRDMLPALRVYSSATAQGRSINIPDFLSTLNLVIQIVAEDITDACSAAVVDELCEAVKEELLSDPSWLVLSERVLSIDTEIERNVEGEQRTTVATLTWRCNTAILRAAHPRPPRPSAHRCRRDPAGGRPQHPLSRPRWTHRGRGGISQPSRPRSGRAAKE